MQKRLMAASAVAFVLVSLLIGACHVSEAPETAAFPKVAPPDRKHLHQVMTSQFCAKCHPAIYAEHAENTHGRAFTDAEVRLATGRFGHGDCIRCHTPRPIFETGNGLNPLRRHHNLEEGNTCMSCHLKADHDYSTFHGGAECKTAFDPRVGTVEACGSCHRNHGTPYQWELAPTGKASGKTCMTCHMKRVRRPVAVGEKPRLVRSHVFPGVRSEEHVRRAYSYSAELDGNEVVVKIKNKGCGHNFPTELKQRSVESLVVVRDLAGNEIARSRMVFRDPYKRPYGLHLPVNTQIPGGQTREHRVPVGVAGGTVDCELHFKLYYPIEDHHPELSRMLEQKRLVFDGITPSKKEVESAPPVKVVTPEGIDPGVAGAPNLVDYVRPKIAKVKIDIPTGSGPDDIEKLIQLFQFPVPEGNRLAQKRLAEIGLPAVPALIEALGSWDNKTFKQASKVLKKIRGSAPALIVAMDSDQLYIRLHARKILTAMGWLDDAGEAAKRFVRDIGAKHVVDRITAAEAAGPLRLEQAVPALRVLLRDTAPDAVRAAALSLADLGDSQSVGSIRKAMHEAYFPETRRDLAEALARLGSVDGIPVLMEGLDHRDDLLREASFESLFAVTGKHFGFDPLAPRPERLQAISRLQAFWARDGVPNLLRTPPYPGRKTHDYAWHQVTRLATQQDEEAFGELIAMGDSAVSGLVLGLKYPPGFASRRARICEALGRIGSKEAAPALIATLRDPVVSVASWAAWALESSKDKEAIPALRRFRSRLLTLGNTGRLPPTAGTLDGLLGQVARTRLMLGDKAARQDLVNLLLSKDVNARTAAFRALEEKYGESFDYDPNGDIASRRAAAKRWQEDAGR